MATQGRFEAKRKADAMTLQRQEQHYLAAKLGEFRSEKQ
jgi:hypothetical protein